MEALAKLHSTVVAAYRVNPNITFEVFIHKVDGLSEDYKIGKGRRSEYNGSLVHSRCCALEILIARLFPLFHASDTQRDIQQTTTDELADAGLENVQLAFYLTSIYDHSIFEAFSKVIQKLIPQLPTLENLLNILCAVRLLQVFSLLYSVVAIVEGNSGTEPVLFLSLFLFGALEL